MPLIVGTRNLVVSSSGSPSHLFLLVFLGDSIYYLHCYKVVGGHPKGSIRHACAYVASGCLGNPRSSGGGGILRDHT
ncbi:uncharacterized protein [Solanum tuberosum]|uniref:uncharacterized protein isoform X3 n=1 Tax=Solanum tuberosum TaxID=4113 RepID=UPI00073A36E3|nr:PREDICTED: uncharacterized protein LOC102604356 isoform X3 [Solanum tuberosum]